jgi:hypothetical protein
MAGQLADGFGNSAELIVAEVEHTEVLQISNALGELRQMIVGEDEGFEISSLPDGFGHLAEVLFPEVEMKRIRFRHERHRIALKVSCNGTNTDAFLVSEF